MVCKHIHRTSSSFTATHSRSHHAVLEAKGMAQRQHDVLTDKDNCESHIYYACMKLNHIKYTFNVDGTYSIKQMSMLNDAINAMEYMLYNIEMGAKVVNPQESLQLRCQILLYQGLVKVKPLAVNKLYGVLFNKIQEIGRILQFSENDIELILETPHSETSHVNPLKVMLDEYANHHKKGGKTIGDIDAVIHCLDLTDIALYQCYNIINKYCGSNNSS